MKGYYIYIHSPANISYKNNFFDFTVDFPQSIDLSKSDWELGLCEFSFTKAKISTAEKCPNMFLCCDIIAHSFCNNKSIPVLRFIPEMKGKHFRNFDFVYYFDVIVKYLDRIRIYIKDNDGDMSSFEDEILYCTLHLREKINQDEIHKSDRGQ